MVRHFPIQFSPSNDPFAYIYYHPDDSKFKKKDIIDNVCELRRVNLDDMDNSFWDLMRIRTDRKIELDKGTYFGNGFYVAEYTWQNYTSPLLFSDLIISGDDFIDRGYFQEEKLEMYRHVTAFNSFVKRKLLDKFKNAKWLVDLAAGKGQDLFRVSNANIKNALFIDNDPQALSELITRKNDFRRGIKTLNTRIYTKVVDLTSEHEHTINSIKKIGVPVGSIDVVMCNFAIHYFTETPARVRNIVQLVWSLLKPGGHFFFTAFSGKKIFNSLKNKDVWDIREGPVLKYSIKKKYKSNNLEQTGQKIDVILPFSGGRYYTEYLVNFDYLLNEFKSNNFVVEKRGGFKSFLPLFKSESEKFYKKISKDDAQFLALYDYAMVRKKIGRGQKQLDENSYNEKISEIIETHRSKK